MHINNYVCISVYIHMYRYAHIFTKIDMFLNGQVKTICAIKNFSFNILYKSFR